MKLLDKFELALPRFVNEQGLFAEHLNAMSSFIEMLLLKRFSATRQRGGVLQGFAVEVDERRRQLLVSPGLAVDAEGRLIYLPAEKKIQLPEEKAPAPAIVFAVRRDNRTDSRKEGNNELGQFQFHDCCLGYWTEDEFREDKKHAGVEIGRVKFAAATFVSQIEKPRDLLNPQPNELDLREVIWLGATEVEFLRPELQQALAQLTTKLTAEIPLSQLGLAQLQTLATTPSFCRRGLLSREQLIDFIQVMSVLHQQPEAPWADWSNSKLVQKLYAFDEEAPAEIRLTRGRLQGLIDLKRHESVTVRFEYSEDLLAFVLTLRRNRNGQIESSLADYQKEFRQVKVFHTWDEADQARNQLRYPGAGAPESLKFYSNVALDRDRIGIRQRLFKCRFHAQGNRVKAEMLPEKVEAWPKSNEHKVQVY